MSDHLLMNALGIREAQLNVLESLIKHSRDTGYLTTEQLEEIKEGVTKGVARAEMKEALEKLEDEE